MVMLETEQTDNSKKRAAAKQENESICTGKVSVAQGALSNNQGIVLGIQRIASRQNGIVIIGSTPEEHISAGIAD